MRLATKHWLGKTLTAWLWKSGASATCYRIKYEDGLHIIVRFATLGRAILRTGKTRNEVVTMKYIRQNAPISVPEVLDSGVCWAGPCIVMLFLEGQTLSELIKGRSKEGRPVLNTQMSDWSLKWAYREMAYVMLELSSAIDYFELLAMQHLLHLQLQKRYAVHSEEDCWRKYIFRCLFLLDITKKPRPEHPQGSFRL